MSLQINVPKFLKIALFSQNFSGGLRPPSPPQGLRPWTPLGAAPPDPRLSSLGGASRHLARNQNVTHSLRSQVGLATNNTLIPSGGSVWLCNGCRTQNELVPTNISKSLQDDVVTPSPDEEDDTKEDDGRPSPRRDLIGNEEAGEDVSNGDTTSEQLKESSGDNANTNAQQKPAGKICEGYKNHNCPHGVSGKREVGGRTCPNLHPRICRKFIRNGNRARGGCQKGDQCRFYHPKLC